MDGPAPRTRLGAAIIAAVLVTVAASAAAAAPTGSDVDDAFDRAEQLLAEAGAAADELMAIEQRVADITAEVEQQTREVEQIHAELVETRGRIAAAQAAYERTVAELEDRIADAFMEGPGSTVGVLLGSESFTELTDRIEFVGAVATNDATIANRATNLRNELEVEEESLRSLEARSRDLLAQMSRDQEALEEQVRRQSALVQEIEAKQAEAHAYAEELDAERQQYLDDLAEQAAPPPSPSGGPLPPGGSGALQACPVDQPRVITNSFGAPRYVGGYHPHAGVDIMAPGGTPIRAAISGVARDASNSSGGTAVIVEGPSGWVYNAHMSGIAKLGSVQAGEIIGYVGMTGASGAGVNHNHFEYHPSSVPSSWPASPYGYSIINGDAVNPYPVLLAVC